MRRELGWADTLAFASRPYKVSSIFTLHLGMEILGFPGGPVVKNPRCNVGDVGLIPGRGTKIPHAMGQLSPHIATTDYTCQEKIPGAATKT